MTRKISRLGLLLSMASVLGDGVPLPEPSLYRDPETRRRALSRGVDMHRRVESVERAKTQREMDAEAKRARRRERNLRLAAKAAPTPAKKGTICDAPCAWRAPVSPAGDYFESEPSPYVAADVVPWALTPNQRLLLTHLEGGYDRPVAEILPCFPTPQSARATIAAAVKVGLVEVLGVLIRITPYGVVSLAAAC